jgi:hypothetical protein
MSRIFDALYSSEKIVKSIGNATLVDGRSLSESLIIDGIPYWDVFASELASRYIPSAFGEISFRESIIQLIKPSLIKAKYFFRDLTRIHKHKDKYKKKSLSNRILCLEFMPQQSRDVMQPIVRYLVDQKNLQVISLRDKKWPDLMDNLSPKELQATIWDFWNDELNIKANRLNKQSKLIKNHFIKSKVLEQITNIKELAFGKRIQIILNRLFTGELPSLIRQGVISKFILEKYRPSLVLVSDIHDPRTRIFLLQCKHLNIPSLAVQHGLTNASATEWRFFPADRVAVWGKHFKDILITHGIASDKIFVTGPPRIDSLLNSSDFDIKSLKRKLGIPISARIILLASTFVLDSYDKFNNDAKLLEAMKRAVFKSLDNLENTYLIVKPHPQENENETKSFALNKSNIIFIDKKEDIRPLTKICDCFVSFNSTTTIDALLLNKLVVCPSFPGWVWNNTYTDTQAVFAPTSAKEIHDIFKVVSKSNHMILISKLKHARNKLVSNWIYRYDGLCANRIGNLAFSMSRNI